MDPESWIGYLSSALRETIIVAQFLVIVYLFRRLDQAREDQLDMMKTFSKEQSELQVATNKSVDNNTNLMSAFIDMAKQSLGRRP